MADNADTNNVRHHAALSPYPPSMTPTASPSLNRSIEMSHPHHPRDGFSALRFSVGISKAALRQPTTGLEPEFDINDDDDDDDNDDEHHDEFLLQPIELCFHEPFVPTPSRPLSLHFENPNSVTLYKAAPTVLTPTPPRYIVEYNPVLLGPTEECIKPNEHNNPQVLGGGQQGIMTVALRRFPTVGLGLTCIHSSAVAASLLSVLIALLWLLPLSLVTWPRNLWTNGCPSENLAEVQHATTVLPIFSEILSVAEEWAEIPRILIDLEQQQKQNAVEDVDLPVLSRKLEIVGELAHELVRDIGRAHPACPLSPAPTYCLSDAMHLMDINVPVYGCGFVHDGIYEKKKLGLEPVTMELSSDEFGNEEIVSRFGKSTYIEPFMFRDLI
ncbi:hypothetical protein QIS74_11679 [Colletotrichum tabaci]|uniref:Uncharacterized protein n=1 Tax=Colletotrichum tabaci TaxID=1209068 RepID=A0AAV9T173_9PEZI